MATREQYIPTPIPGIEMSHIQINKDNDYYVLHNPKSNTYLKVDPENFYLWQLIDGKRSVTDIILAYYEKFGSYPLERLSDLMKQLEANYIIERDSGKSDDSQKGDSKDLLEKLAADAFQKEFAFKNADKFFDTVYRYFGRFFFMKPTLIILSLISLSGFVLFIYWEREDPFYFINYMKENDFAFIALIILFPILTFLHELGHALTCKYYSRRVNKAGLMFYLGMPLFFVDSTDMWLEEKRFARAAVAFAGPAVNMFIAGFFCLVVAIIPWNKFAMLLYYQIVYLNFFLVLLNLNPLLEYDGYYILSEYLGIHNLRKASFSYIFNSIKGKLKKNEYSSRERRIYAIYGSLSLVYTAMTILLVLYIWESRFAKFISIVFSNADLSADVFVSILSIIAGACLAVGLFARCIIYFKKLVKKKPIKERG